MATCPSGHESSDYDFCDVCGVTMGGARMEKLADKGNGKAMRHVKLRPGVAIDEAALQALIAAAYAHLKQRLQASIPAFSIKSAKKS